MIIPVRCFTCNKVLGDKWEYYVRRVEELRAKGEIPDNEDDEDVMTYNVSKEQAPRGKLLTEMGITRMCCVRHMLGHVDLIEII